MLHEQFTPLHEQFTPEIWQAIVADHAPAEDDPALPLFHAWLKMEHSSSHVGLEQRDEADERYARVCRELSSAMRSCGQWTPGRRAAVGVMHVVRDALRRLACAS